MSLILNQLKIANNLAVGKSTATTTLDVSGAAYVTGSLKLSGNSNSLIFDADSSGFVGRYALLPGRFAVGTLSSGYPEIGYNFSPANSVYTKLANDTAWRIGFGNNNLLNFGYAASGTGTFTWSEAMVINLSGNVAIGKTSPINAKLDVYGDTKITGSIAISSTSDSAITSRGGALFGPNTTWSRYLLVGGDGRQNYTDNSEVASVCTTNGNLHLDPASGFGSYINWYDGSELIVGAGNSSTYRFYINSSGNVGIGRTDQAYKLDVSGDIRATSTILGTTLNGTSYLQVNSRTVLSATSNNSISRADPLWGFIKSVGKKLYYDEEFYDGYNSISVYNNYGGSAVTHTRKNSSFLDGHTAQPPNSSGYVIEIKHEPTLSPGITPGYGGWYFGTSTGAGKRFLCVFKMKIPSGRTVEFATNNIGTNGTSNWVTSKEGTGYYEDYAFHVNSGTGSWSSTLFFYISGGSSSTFYTYLASATVYEISNVSEEVMRSMTIGKNAGSNVALDVYGNAYITGSLTVTGTISGAVGGVSGTTNYIPKFTSTTAIGNSLIYDNGTNVGIGTTNPVAKFDVGGNIVASGSVLARDTTEAQVQLRYAGATPNVSYVFNAATAFGFFDSTNARHMSYYDRSGDSWYFYTSGSTRMTIDASGDVGIGITNPSYKLDITDNSTGIQARINSSSPNGTSIQFNSSATNGRLMRIGHNFVTGTGEFAIYDDTAAATRLFISSSGNIGVGTTTPSFGKLTVSSTVAATASPNYFDGLALYNQSDGASRIIGVNSLGTHSAIELGILSSGAGTDDGVIRFSTATNGSLSTRMVIDNVGNVGIGTTGPSYKLDVTGDIRATGTIYGTLSGTATNAGTLDGYDSLAFCGQSSLFAGSDFQYGGLGLSSTGFSLSSATTDADQHGRYYYSGSSGQIITRYIPVDKNASSIYRMKIRWKASSAAATYIAVFLLDTSGNNISVAGTYWAYPFSGGAAPTSWTENEYIYFGTDFPSNAAYVAFGISHTNYGGGSATYYVSQLEIERTVATSTNTAGKLVFRDASGNFSAGTITATLSGNASTITNQANSATITATSANTANQIVLRDGSGNFSAGTATLAAASLSGLISTSATEAIRINKNNGYISVYDTAGTTRTGYLQGNPAGSVILAAENGATLQFYVSTTERMRINTSGNVGIGITDPSSFRLYSYGGPIAFNYSGASAYANDYIHEVSRTVSSTNNAYTEIGTLAAVGKSMYATIEIFHHDCNAIEYSKFELITNYYTGATTDWVQLPSRTQAHYAGDRNGVVVDARLATTGGNIELRLRSIGGACGDMTVSVRIKSNSILTESSGTGTGASVAGLLGFNRYEFPVTNDRFKATTDGLFINPNGNIGISKTTPTSKLDVNGTTTVTGSLLVTGSMIIAGDLIPAEDRKYSLGTSTRRWNDLYVISSSVSQITESLMTISNEYTLAVVNGNRIAGFKIAIASQTSSFTIQADKFQVVNDSGNNPISPFIIENNIVYINSASIKNLTADNIKARTITADKIVAGSITADEIKANTITTDKLTANVITANEISASSITTDKLQANSITTDKLQANSITTDKLQANSITAAKIAADAVTATQISASAITTDKLAANSITSAKIAADAITATQIAADAVTTVKLAASAITSAKIAADAITTDKLAANAITSAKIAADAITTDKLAANAITSAKIAADAVTATQIAADAVTTTKLAANAITSAKIAADAITSTQISASAITSAKIAADAVTATQIAADAVTTTKLAANAITSAKIAADAVTATQIAANAITAAKISAGAIETDKLAANAITAAKIAADAITTDKLAANAITAAKIATDAITADKIAANAITTAKIDAGAITSAKIAAGAITANMIAAGTISAAVSIQGGQTAYDTGTGWYLSSDGKFSLGNSGGNKVVWDGTKLKVTGGIYITDTIGIRNDGNSTLTITGGPSNASGGQIDLTPSGIVSLVATGGQYIQFYAGGAQRGFVQSDGKFDWLGTSEFDGAMTVNNTVTATSFNSTSSRKYKKNIKDLTNGLSVIQKLRPVTFDWKDKNVTNDIGMIAEEVHEILPTIVNKDENGNISGLEYGKLTAALISAVKELSEELKDVKSQLSALKNK